MHGCAEVSLVKEYRNKVWTCLTNSFLDRAKDEVVFLDNYSGCFLVRYLKSVNQ